MCAAPVHVWVYWGSGVERKCVLEEHSYYFSIKWKCKSEFVIRDYLSRHRKLLYTLRLAIRKLIFLLTLIEIIEKNTRSCIYSVLWYYIFFLMKMSDIESMIHPGLPSLVVHEQQLTGCSHVLIFSLTLILFLWITYLTGSWFLGFRYRVGVTYQVCMSPSCDPSHIVNMDWSIK